MRSCCQRHLCRDCRSRGSYRCTGCSRGLHGLATRYPLRVSHKPVSTRTRAVIAVDLYGQLAPMGEIRDVVSDDVMLFEDAAQSQGASRSNQPAGSFGTAAATSSTPENLGAYGDAGAVLTNSADIAARVRALRSHGGEKNTSTSTSGELSTRLHASSCAIRQLGNSTHGTVSVARRHSVLGSSCRRRGDCSSGGAGR